VIERVPETVYVTVAPTGRFAVVLIVLPLPLAAPHTPPSVTEPQVQVTLVIKAGTVSVTIDPLEAPVLVAAFFTTIV